MRRLLGWLAGKLRGFLGLFLPVLQKARGPGQMPGWLRVVLHVLVVVLLLAGLYLLNQLPAILVLIPRRQLLARSWLPILFLLLYTLCWLSYWLWKLLVSEDEGPRFADIDEAWAAALTALRQAGLHVGDLPLFLFLGQPADEEPALFQAAQLNLLVKQAPADPEAPLHVYATREAIYLTCAGASLLGRHARWLAGKLLGKGPPQGGQPGGEQDSFLTSTIDPRTGGPPPFGPGEVAGMARLFQQAELEGRPLTKVEKRELRLLYRENQPQRSPLTDPDTIASECARLRYLCRLLVRDRRPFCAINGVLLLLPYAGCDSDQDAVWTAEAVQRDLAVAGAALGVDCPHFAVVCDLESAYGFSEFVEQFTARERLRRLGQSCPLMPDLQVTRVGKEGAVKMLDSLARWVCESVVPTWVYHKFQLEKADTPERTALVRANGRLFLLADELKQRARRLGTILTRGLVPKSTIGPLMFGGCYLAGTGSDPEREQGFVRGLLDRLTEGQSCVYWTRRTLEEEAVYTRWVGVGWAVLSLAILALLAVGGYFWYLG
jgi:hypothetical protein